MQGSCEQRGSSLRDDRNNDTIRPDPSLKQSTFKNSICKENEGAKAALNRTMEVMYFFTGMNAPEQDKEPIAPDIFSIVEETNVYLDRTNSLLNDMVKVFGI